LGFVFEWFRELIHDQLSLEEFMVLWDVSSTRPLWKKDTLSTLELLQSSKALEKIEQGSMLILDEIVFLTLSRIEQENVKQVLELRGILLLMC
jgi:ATP:corrinoid adenosyltransferase